MGFGAVQMTMTTFTIDTELTRHLARELFAATQETTPPLPHIPDGSLSAFGAHLCDAVANLNSRTESLRADMEEVAAASVAMAEEADAADSATATHLGGLLS